MSSLDPGSSILTAVCGCFLHSQPVQIWPLDTSIQHLAIPASHFCALLWKLNQITITKQGTSFQCRDSFENLPTIVTSNKESFRSVSITMKRPPRRQSASDEKKNGQRHFFIVVHHHSASASSSNDDIADTARAQLAIWHWEMEAAMLAKRMIFLKASSQTSKSPTLINHKDPSTERVLTGRVLNNNCTRGNQHRDVQWGMTSGRQYYVPEIFSVFSITLRRH